MIAEHELVRDIAVRMPGATEIFRSHKIDFCFKGDVPLADAARSRGVDLAVLTNALAALSPSAESAPVATAELIDHIIERYHEVHAREFPEAIRLARRVEAVHRGHPNCPGGLADHLDEMWLDLRSHQDKEEAVLFPMMQTGGSAMIAYPIRQMMIEHEEVGRQLVDLATLTTDFVPPSGACTTWRALYQACQKLDADLREHMHLENNVLFASFL
jgi:regulator of cell morphogenesis and NO signaling